MSILRDILLNIRTIIKQALPAQPCVLCGSLSHDGLWCKACDTNLPYLKMPHCPVCALPTPGGETCGHCLAHPPRYARTTAAFRYAFPLAQLIQAMKYHEQLALAQAFAERLSRRVDSTELPDYLIPMPLHPAKLRERGFNQSLLLATELARRHHIELLPHACQRVRDTPPQSALPWKKRKKNMCNAFRCDIDLTGKRVGLIDDVLTTGASLDALAAAVQRRGASEIHAWVVARTLPHKR